MKEKKGMRKKKVRLPLGDIELRVLSSLAYVTFLPGSGDKKFYKSIKSEKWLTEAQRKYLFAIFDKYRKQIPNYHDIALELEPNRFKVNVTFENTLFGVESRIEVKDTFTAKDRWTKADRQRNTLI